MAFPQVLITLLLVASIATESLAATSEAPGPAPPGKINLTAILEKGGQFSTLIKLLDSTQVGSQIENQVESSTEGMTLFAPTDNAFQSLKAGTINDLTTQQQVELIQDHVLPKYYALGDFETVSNPVRTQATGQDGQPFGLNITSTGNNQVNVSTGLVQTQLNNVLRKDFPLAVYQVDMVLLPRELFDPKYKAVAKAPSASLVGSTPAKGKAKADGPVGQAADEKNGGVGVRSLGLGFVFGLALATFAFLS